MTLYYEVDNVKFLKIKRLLEWFFANDVDGLPKGQPILIQDQDENGIVQNYYMDYWFMYTLQKGVMCSDYSWSVRGWLNGINDPVARQNNKTVVSGVSMLPQCELHSDQGHVMNNMKIKTMSHKGTIVRIEHDGVTSPESCILR